MPYLFDKISFSGEAVADLIFFLSAAFAAVVSLVLFFHWRKYGMGGITLALTEFIYLGVSAALLLAAFLSLN